MSAAFFGRKIMDDIFYFYLAADNFTTSLYYSNILEVSDTIYFTQMKSIL